MAGVYKAPGVYIEEAPSGPAAISGKLVGVMGFQGVCQKGPADTPVEINNWTEFKQVFGEYTSAGSLAYIYKNFLDNGGGKVYIRRPARTSSAIAAAELDNASAAVAIDVDAKSFGTWGNFLKAQVAHDPKGTTALSSDYTNASGLMYVVVDSLVGFTVGEYIKISDGSNTEYRKIESLDAVNSRIYWASAELALTNDYAAATPTAITSMEFTLTIWETVSGVDYQREEWKQLSTVDGLANYYEDVVNDSSYPASLGSNYVTLEDKGLVGMPTRMPVEVTETLAGGLDGSLNSSGDADFSCLDAVIDEITAMSAPESAASVQTAGSVNAENNNGVFAIDSPLTTDKAGVITYRNETLGIISSYAMLYWPNFVVVDPIGVGNNPEKTISCLGGVLGRTAYIQNKYGPWRSPAGTIANIQGIKRLYIKPSQNDQVALNPIGVNVIRPVQNINRIFGARTLESPPADYRYANIRYSFCYIEKSVKEGTAWINFENNDERLWSKIKSNVGAYLRALGQAGAFKGTKPSEWFYIKCDDELNTEQQQDTGYCLCEVGLALSKPAEFMVFTFSQMTQSA